MLTEWKLCHAEFSKFNWKWNRTKNINLPELKLLNSEHISHLYIFIKSQIKLTISNMKMSINEIQIGAHLIHIESSKLSLSFYSDDNFMHIFYMKFNLCCRSCAERIKLIHNVWTSFVKGFAIIISAFRCKWHFSMHSRFEWKFWLS